MERSKSIKRKFPFSGMQRRVRARKEESEPDLEDQLSGSSEEESDEDEDSKASPGENVTDSGSSGEEENESEAENASSTGLAASKISFGALAKAQASLPHLRRKGVQQDDPSSSSDSDSGFEAEDRHPQSTKTVGRSSKHAPAEQTSKRAVSRKREVVVVQKRQARDPRFGPTGGASDSAPLREVAARQKYAFLDEYRNSEMSQLKTAIKTTKDPAAKEQLQRALASMKSKKQAQERKDAERAVVEEHRRQDKELVKQGKKPFYLKRSEQKKRLLMDRFAGMKKREVDRAIERRRKKVTAKERKELPMERRER